MCFMNILKNITRIAWKKDPEPGEQGERGAIPRMRKFVVGVEYQCGASGEEFLDYAYYDGVWYRCRDTHTPTGDQNPFDDIGHGYDTWSAESGFDFLSTKCMIVGDDGEGWIMEKGTFTHTSGKVKFNSDGSANFNNKCTISADGILKSIGGVFEGRLQLPLNRIYGYGHTFDENTGAAIILNGYLTLPEDSKYDGYVIEIFGQNIISRSDYAATLYGRIALPWLTQDSGAFTHVYVATQISLPKGGYLRLMCVDAKWSVIAHLAPTVEYSGAYESEYMF